MDYVVAFCSVISFGQIAVVALCDLLHKVKFWLVLDAAEQRFWDKRQKRRNKRSRADMIGIAATISQDDEKHAVHWAAAEGGVEVAVLGVKN